VCGIAGFIGSGQPDLVDKMLAAVASRGPDGTRRFSGQNAEFVFTRLSINDLTETGEQPMFAADGRIVAMMNGEIYNSPELRRALESKGRQFRGTSDAEVVPHGFAEWGVELFSRLRGMFAIAIYDIVSKELILARDHFGIKPMYYATTRDGVAFSSSARAVSLHPDVGQTLNHRAMTELLQYRFVPSGSSLYENVQTLMPGHFAVCHGSVVSLHNYWRRNRFAESASASEGELVECFSELLLGSIRRELTSDVPLGVLLSGGVDSGAVLTGACAAKARGLSAYTYEMRGSSSEVDLARDIADSHGVIQRVVTGKESEFVDTFVRAVQCMDLPVGDAIIAPTYQLLAEVRKERKVVLTGEGADELLAGYAHVRPLQLLHRIARTGAHPTALAALVKCTPWRVLDAFFPYDAVLGKSGKKKLVEIVQSAREPRLALTHTISVFDENELQTGTNLPPLTREASVGDLTLSTLIDWGFASWLPNQILNKMDQLSMANGVEARVPFVSVELYEFVSTLPARMLLSRKGNKRVLREALKTWGYSHPEQPKRAFFTPLTSRHQRELEALAREWLSTSMNRKHGVITDGLVRETIEKVRAGDFLASKQIVTLATLHIWLEQDFRR
jgi:asparagine synthase (glutamine-hydrolysing)